MTKEAKLTSEYLKDLLSHHAGGKASDWSRIVPKQKVMWGDVRRVFENRKTGEKAEVYERPDGLIYAELPGGKKVTDRPYWPGAKFDPQNTPEVSDLYINALFEEADISPKLQKAAQKAGVISRFSFVILKYDEDYGHEHPLHAYIYPTDRDSTFKCQDQIEALLTGADGVDECVTTEWRFPKEIDTPAKLALHLLKSGVQWDIEEQKRDKKLYAEIVAELGGQPEKAAVAQPGVTVEADPLRNAIADKIILIANYKEKGQDRDRGDVSYRVPDAMVKAAGKALANRYCFALAADDPEGQVTAVITPIDYFKENGSSDDQNGPIDALLPRCSNAMEATWDVNDLEDPMEAVKYLQNLGFVWNKKFQEFIDSNQEFKILPMLEKQGLEESAVKARPATKSKGPKR